MLNQNKSNTFQALWVGMGSLSTFGLSIISAAVLSRYFDKSEYGTYRQILYVYNTFLVVFSAGLPRVFAYFLPRFNISHGKDIVWRITKLLFGGGFLFSLFLFFLSGPISCLLKNPQLETGLKYFSPIPMLLLPTLGIEGIFSVYRNTFFIALYNTITRSLMLLFIVVPVILLNGTFIHAIFGWISASFLSLMIAFYFKTIPFKGVKSVSADLSYKELFSYCIPLVTASMAGIAIKAADQFYISRFFGSNVFAEFSNGFIELPFVLMITGATSTVLMPVFSKMNHDKTEINQVTNLFRSALLKSATLIYPLVIFFFYNAENVIILLYSTTYVNSASYFRIAAILNLFNIIIFAPLLLAMGKTKVYSQIHIVFALVGWVFGYITIVVFDSPVAIAILSVSLAILKVLVCLKYAANLMEIKAVDLLPLKKISFLTIHSLLIVAVVKFLVTQFFPQMHILFSLAVNFTGYLLLTILTSKLFSLDYLWILNSVFQKKKFNRA